MTYVPVPDLVRVQLQPGSAWVEPSRSSVAVSCLPDVEGLAIIVEAEAVSMVHLRWHQELPTDALVLGDAWERTYGDLAWHAARPEQLHPWMVVVHSPTGGSWGAGVDVRTGSFAGWSVDPAGLSLWLDLRAGADPVQLGGRSLTAAVVRWVTGDDAYATQCDLASAVCRDPLPMGPLVGANNWYYAYGKNFGLDAVIRDARMISELSGSHPVRPFAVVDDGWSVDGVADGRLASGGPWDCGRGDFSSMADTAEAIAAEGVRPGLWFRPLLSRETHAAALRPWDGAFSLDPSHPAAVDEVVTSIRRFRTWGFDLIKHDFSTYETLGRWGFQMGPSPVAPGVHVADRTRTTAEVLVDLYRAIHDAAGDGLVLGCNVVGHLAAGLVQAQRTGDDTSGRTWERTRRMGVNTLAFRLAQHGRFFTVDADCVASTPQTDWALNRQFLDLVARSGTALFVSIDPTSRTDAVDADLAAALRIALDGGQPGGIEPLDWFSSPTPTRWRCGDGVRTYDWQPPAGSDPYELGGTLYS